MRQQRSRDKAGDGDNSVGTSGVEGDAGGGTGQVVLSLEHLQGPFLVLFLGCLAGGLVLLLELLLKLLLYGSETN